MNRFTFFSKVIRQGTTIVTQKEQSLSSHKLLLNSGLLSVSSTGVFTYSPIILRVVEKLTAFLDYKMTEVGGQKCLFPAIGKSKLWSQSGRWEKFGEEMFRFQDRHGKSFCLQPTHEEEVCNFVNNLNVGSSLLPLRLYQISTKFRDEIQPKLGLLRCREFLMKDLYSFDLDIAGAKKTYENLSDTYSSILNTIGVPFFRVTAEGGLMGDCPSDEFHCPLPIGEDSLLVCQTCNKGVLCPQSSEDVMCPACGTDRQIIKSVEVAHCFLLGDNFPSIFDVKASTSSGHRTLQMGCYGIGVTRLLATALEYFTAVLTKNAFPSELRWPLGFAPYSGAIALQKENAKDALSTSELHRLLSCFKETPSLNPGSTSFFAGLLPRGDILVDDRPRLSLGRKLVDLRQLGVPWILIAKSGKGDINFGYELVNVHHAGVSISASLEDTVCAFTRSDFGPSLEGARLWRNPINS